MSVPASNATNYFFLEFQWLCKFIYRCDNIVRFRSFWVQAFPVWMTSLKLTGAKPVTSCDLTSVGWEAFQRLSRFKMRFCNSFNFCLIRRRGYCCFLWQVRDLCVTLGITVAFDDFGGSEITGSTLAHLTHSTPPKFRFQSSCNIAFVLMFTSWVTTVHFRFRFTTSDFRSEKVAQDSLIRSPASIGTSNLPGLGLKINEDVLGEPCFVVQWNGMPCCRMYLITQEDQLCLRMMLPAFVLFRATIN